MYLPMTLLGARGGNIGAWSLGASSEKLTLLIFILSCIFILETEMLVGNMRKMLKENLTLNSSKVSAL